MRSIRLLKTFLRSAFQQETAYRLNFFLQLLGTALGLAGSLGGILILFANNEHLNGWSMSQTLAVLGVYLLVQALNSLAVSPSLNQLGGMGGELETGNFDYTLLKPISKQFYVSLRTWSFWPLLDAAAAVVVLVLAVSGQQTAVTPGNALLFLLTLLIALGLVYALMLLLTSVAFWYRGTYVLWILNDVMQAGRYPIGLYPRSVRLLLTWVLPIGFIVTVWPKRCWASRPAGRCRPGFCCSRRCSRCRRCFSGAASVGMWARRAEAEWFIPPAGPESRSVYSPSPGYAPPPSVCSCSCRWRRPRTPAPTCRRAAGPQRC